MANRKLEKEIDNTKNKAIFLDRDGVLVKEVYFLYQMEDINILPSVPLALNKLKKAGFKLIVVSNQPVIARGMASEKQVVAINNEIQNQIIKSGGPKLDSVFFCPHHPNAHVQKYRNECQCRKPRTGMIQEAATQHNIDLKKSYMIGDRITDVIAGHKANCKTILLTTGAHAEPPIEALDEIDLSTKPSYTAAGLLEAATWILEDAHS
jgi:D-glycero-D-manno-heptose 1,7-bisphosphate phosphatase